MKNFALRTFALSAVLGCFFVSSHISAQESTAGGTLGAQASWTALQNMLTATNGNVSLLRTDVDAMKACGVQKKIWTGTQCADSAAVDSIVACGKLGKTYGPGAADADANGCVATTDTSLRWSQGIRLMSAKPNTVAYHKELSKAKSCAAYGGDNYEDGDSSIAGQRCSTRGLKCSNSHYGNCGKKEGTCTTFYTCD